MKQVKIIVEQKITSETAEGILAMRQMRLKLARENLLDIDTMVAKVSDHSPEDFQSLDYNQLKSGIHHQLVSRIERYENLAENEFYEEELKIYLDMVERSKQAYE